MAQNLSKKTLRIIAIILGLLSIGVTGYIIWRIEEEEPVTPTEIEADYDCLRNGVPVPCASIGKVRCHCPDGTWIIGTGTCWSVCSSHNATTSGRTSSGGSCTQGSQCAPCEWPNVAYCGCLGDSNPSHRKCGCRLYNSTFSCGPQCGSVNKCTPGSCPSGWIECGISGSSGATAAGCVAKTSCTGACSGCSNEFIIKRYCREPEPSCGDGILGNTPGEECELGDPDGVSCLWDDCDQDSCLCPELEELGEEPELPETGIFDPSSLAITVSVSMIVYGGVMGIAYYLQNSKDRKAKSILRRLGL